LQNIGKEHQQRQRLLEHGIDPTKSAILIGPPGVGKTMSARWLATQLNKPLWILDLSAVMSSLLGKTGANLRAVFDFAKKNEAVLLLDEIDAIAKRRSDESDIGELKRLVTVILQEVDAWPSTGLLLAATNHPELIDPALWRRFDAVLEFNQPAAELLGTAIKRFFGQDCAEFGSSLHILQLCFENNSFSNVERAINSIRRDKVLNNISPSEAVINFVHANLHSLSKQARHDLAIELAKSKDISHNKIMALTGVSRDTIRKYAGPSPIKGRGLNKSRESNG
jgi:replication-associated recombination protein RarA